MGGTQLGSCGQPFNLPWDLQGREQWLPERREKWTEKAEKQRCWFTFPAENVTGRVTVFLMRHALPPSPIVAIYVSFTCKHASLRFCHLEPKQLNQDTTALHEAASSHQPRPRVEMLNCQHAQKVFLGAQCNFPTYHVTGWSVHIAAQKTAFLTGVSGQDLYTFIISMYLVTTKSRYCSGNKRLRECHWNCAEEASVITSVRALKKIIVLYRTIPNDTLLSTFRFCAHLLHRNNMQNGCYCVGWLSSFSFNTTNAQNHPARVKEKNPERLACSTI